jgi:hypothetical protein
MFYAITENGVKQGIKMQQLNKKMDSKIEKEEMKKVGADYVIHLTQSDIQFVQDKKTMSRIPIQRLYKKGNDNLLIYLILGVQLILLIKG